MKKASRRVPEGAPPSENRRLRALEAYELLDSTHEGVYDEIAQLAAELCSAPIALVSILDAHRNVFKGKFGTDVESVDRAFGLCAHTIEAGDMLVIEDARLDPRCAANPTLWEEGGLRFYAGVPLKTPEGVALGALCVVDSRVRTLSDGEARVLRSLARQVEAHFEARLQVRTSERQMRVAAEERDSLVTRQRKEGEIASHVVHDLKSPLTNILYSAQFLSEEAMDPEKREAAEGILSSARHLHQLVMSLLDVGHTDDQASLKLECTDIGAILREVATEASTRLRAVGREVRVRSDLVDAIDLDATMMRRVVENLVDNAVKYSRATITLEARPGLDGDIQIDVRDEGPGIPEEARSRIFERCARLDRDAAIDRTSRGLGLAFCKLAVEAHGGRIWVGDNRPQGAAFHVRLPTAASRASGERFRAEIAPPKREAAGE